MKKYFILLLAIVLFSNCQKNTADDLHAQNQILDSNKVIEPLRFLP